MSARLDRITTQLEPVLTVAEAAAVLKVSPRTLRDWIAQRRIGAIKELVRHRHTLRVPAESIREYERRNYAQPSR